ncbi:glycoside hydrolase superfamily, partial [Russula vinacea]
LPPPIFGTTMSWSFKFALLLGLATAPALAAQSHNSHRHSPSPVPSPASTSTPTPTPFVPFAYGSVPIRGVNLGGWFVLEPWITPSIFNNTNNDAIIDEFTFGQMQEYQAALNVLEDFIAIAAAGLTHVRIPVGYWSVPSNSSVSPYIPGAWPYIQRAVTWARTHGLHTIIDLHGAPGSQNGYDNSGQRTSSPQWALDPANVDATLAIIQVLASQLGPMVDAIELLNEVAGFLGSAWDSAVRDYWTRGYEVVRQAAGNNVVVVIGDAFEELAGFFPSPKSNKVMMDYRPRAARTEDQHIQFVCQSTLPTLATFASNNMWTVSGEWSTAITDCALWLNGRGVGARWDGSIEGGGTIFGSCDGFTGNWTTFSQNYTTLCGMKCFRRHSQTESADEWSYQMGLEGGWIPQDPSQRLYPGLCNG